MLRPHSTCTVLDAFLLEHDPQRDRDLGHVLLSFGGAAERPGELAPAELRPVFRR
jgi:hypothetical protein